MENYIIVKTQVEMYSLPAYKLIAGLLVFCLEDKTLYVCEKERQFTALDNTKICVVYADNFINLTVKHNLNNINVDVIAYNNNTGAKVNLDWKFGNLDDTNDINSITITSSVIVKDHLTITIFDFNKLTGLV